MKQSLFSLSIFAFAMATLSGCSTRHDIESMEDNTITAQQADIFTQDNAPNYSNGMQLMYVYNQREPTKSNNLDVLAKDYYDKLALNNNVMSTATTFMAIGNLASSLNITTFFLGTRKHDKIYAGYKSAYNFAIEPIDASTTYASMYQQDLIDIKTRLAAKYPQADILQYEFKFLNINRTELVAFDVSQQACADFAHSKEFLPNKSYVDEQWRYCYLDTGAPGNKKIIEGELNINGIEKSDRYVVYYVRNEQVANFKHKANLYRYMPFYGWTSARDDYNNQPETLEQDIAKKEVGMFPYVYRYHDDSMILFKLGDEQNGA